MNNFKSQISNLKSEAQPSYPTPEARIADLAEAFEAHGGVMTGNEVNAMTGELIFDLKMQGWIKDHPWRHHGGYVPGPALAAAANLRSEI